MGTLMAKARAKARKSQICRGGAKIRREIGDRQGVAAGGPVIGGVEDEDRDQHEEAAEHGEEDELHRRVDRGARPPQMPMRKYIGMSMASQKT